jgi:hypothetical protein
VRAQKGTDVFVAAMCRLLPRYPDFTAIIVGAVVSEQQGFANGLKRQIEAAGLQSRIVITGELAIEDVQRWYQRLTIYAFTSRNEGFGLTLIEAMSSGAALVAARAGAAEFVVEDGVTGVLTPPGDVEALVAALEPLMRDPVSAYAMGERARARVLQKFSLEAEANAIAAAEDHEFGRQRRDRAEVLGREVLEALDIPRHHLALPGHDDAAAMHDAVDRDGPGDQAGDGVDAFDAVGLEFHEEILSYIRSRHSAGGQGIAQARPRDGPVRKLPAHRLPRSPR